MTGVASVNLFVRAHRAGRPSRQAFVEHDDGPPGGVRREPRHTAPCAPCPRPDSRRPCTTGSRTDGTEWSERPIPASECPAWAWRAGTRAVRFAHTTGTPHWSGLPAAPCRARRARWPRRPPFERSAEGAPTRDPSGAVGHHLAREGSIGFAAPFGQLPDDALEDPVHAVALVVIQIGPLRRSLAGPARRTARAGRAGDIFSRAVFASCRVQEDNAQDPAATPKAPNIALRVHSIFRSPHDIRRTAQQLRFSVRHYGDDFHRLRGQ